MMMLIIAKTDPTPVSTHPDTASQNEYPMEYTPFGGKKEASYLVHALRQ